MSTSPFYYNHLVVKFAYAGNGHWGWAATLPYYDDGFCSGNKTGEPVSTEGELRTRYMVTASNHTATHADNVAAAMAVVGAVVNDATRMGIEFLATGPDENLPDVYLDGDGESWDPEAPLSREEAQEVVTALATDKAWFIRRNTYL